MKKLLEPSVILYSCLCAIMFYMGMRTESKQTTTNLTTNWVEVAVINPTANKYSVEFGRLKIGLLSNGTLMWKP